MLLPLLETAVQFGERVRLKQKEVPKHAEAVRLSGNARQESMPAALRVFAHACES